MMNNKKLGSKFEQDFCELLRHHKYWAHFLEPYKDGSQPFDIIASKNNTTYAFDCKTCKSRTFPLSRIEYNQELAFNKMLSMGNTNIYFAFLNEDVIYINSAKTLLDLKAQGVKSINIGEYDDYSIFE